MNLSLAIKTLNIPIIYLSYLPQQISDNISQYYRYRNHHRFQTTVDYWISFTILFSPKNPLKLTRGYTTEFRQIIDPGFKMALQPISTFSPMIAPNLFRPVYSIVSPIFDFMGLPSSLQFDVIEPAEKCAFLAKIESPIQLKCAICPSLIITQFFSSTLLPTNDFAPMYTFPLIYAPFLIAGPTIIAPCSIEVFGPIYIDQVFSK